MGMPCFCLFPAGSRTLWTHMQLSGVKNYVPTKFKTPTHIWISFRPPGESKHQLKWLPLTGRVTIITGDGHSGLCVTLHPPRVIEFPIPGASGYLIHQPVTLPFYCMNIWTGSSVHVLVGQEEQTFICCLIKHCTACESGTVVCLNINWSGDWSSESLVLSGTERLDWTGRSESLNSEW